MSEPVVPDVATVVQNNVGWLAALGAGSWAWVLRMILGRHLKSLDELRTGFEAIRQSVSKIDARLARIEGRFDEQDAGK